MEWHVYRVALRLEAPLHIGSGKISYLQRTRPYVPARVLRGALVSRLARQPREYATPGDPYHKTGRTISQYMAFTYFFPALKDPKEVERYRPIFPWEPGFRHRFLGSYAGTALTYPQQTVARGLLREIEYIVPRTRDTNEQVYLLGYIFVDEEHIKPKTYDWQSALHQIQIGGERGYGWGRVGQLDIRKMEQPEISLFNTESISFNGRLSKHQGKGQARPVVIASNRLLAHVPVMKASGLRGLIEPIVGREWRPDHLEETRQYIGAYLAFKGLYFAPGSQAGQKMAFLIDRDGFWLPVPVEEA